jgi:hypothetical protein
MLVLTDPKRILEYLRGRASDRKLRLFACACCRRVEHLLTDERSRRAVDVAERYADGQAGEAEQTAAYREAFAVLHGTIRPPLRGREERVAGLAVGAAADVVAGSELGAAFAPTAGPRRAIGWTAMISAAERAAQCDLLRDVFGDPDWPPSIDPAWRAWQGGIVVALARAAYEERSLPAGTLDSARLAVLADALDEAGCADPALLGHLRGAGPHVRGCFAVDAILEQK